MEVYGCLHDMISEIENKDNTVHNNSKDSETNSDNKKEKSPILKLRGCNGGLILIDQHQLKYNPRLEGAEVFKMLFKISDTNPYGDYPMITNKFGYVTLFQELRISCNQWYILKTFLDQGIVPGYRRYLVDGEGYSYVNSGMEELNNVSIKLGGIPSVEQFYKNFYDEDEKFAEIHQPYNPLSPAEDVKQKYEWSGTHQCGEYLRSFQVRHEGMDGWSIANITEGPSRIYWYRRLRNNTSEETEETGDMGDDQDTIEDFTNNDISAVDVIHDSDASDASDASDDYNWVDY